MQNVKFELHFAFFHILGNYSLYNIDEYDLKDIDKYIWQLGKDYFPKKY